MKNVMVYVRESDHTGAEASAQKQAQRVQDYCEKNGYKICDSKEIIGDRKTAFPEFLNALRTAKQYGADTIVMATTDRVAGTVEEIDELQSAIQEYGIAIEALDGSHDPIHSSRMVERFISMVEIQEDEEMQTFGYDIGEGEVTVNEGEAEVARYIFQKMQEYSVKPPVELVQAVMDDYRNRGEKISFEEAATKVPLYRIASLIEDEIKQQWPERYQRLIQKQAHNDAMAASRFIDPKLHTPATQEMGAIIDREMWDKAQEKMSEGMDTPTM